MLLQRAKEKYLAEQEKKKAEAALPPPEPAPNPKPVDPPSPFFDAIARGVWMVFKTCFYLATAFIAYIVLKVILPEPESWNSHLVDAAILGLIYYAVSSHQRIQQLRDDVNVLQYELEDMREQQNNRQGSQE